MSYKPIVAALAVFLALVAGVVLAAPGDHLPAGDFNLNASNSDAVGIAYTGTHLLVEEAERSSAAAGRHRSVPNDAVYVRVGG